jgi:hypothetical protein
MTVTKQVPTIHPAFNPVYVQFKLNPGESGDEIRLTFTDYDDSKYYQVRGDFLGDTCTINLSGVLKQMFDDVDRNTEPETDYTFKSNLLAVSYLLEYQKLVDNVEVNNRIPLGQFIALNAAVQTGRSIAITGDRFLTHSTVLKKYEGYPLEIAFLNADRATYVNFDGITINPDDAIITPHFAIRVPDNVRQVQCTDNTLVELLTTNAGELLTTNAGEQLYSRNGNLPGNPISIPVQHPCIPAKPFYVRWVNDLGGWNYLMFSHRQTVEKTTENGIIAYPVVYDNETTKGYTLQSYLEASETITAGVSMLPADEYEPASKIIYSPEIEWYKEDIGKWVRLTVAGSIIQRDTRHDSGSLEITFNLPEPQIQF